MILLRLPITPKPTPTVRDLLLLHVIAHRETIVCLDQSDNAIEPADHLADVATAASQQRVDEVSAHVSLGSHLVSIVQNDDVTLMGTRLLHQKVHLLQIQKRLPRHVPRLDQMSPAERLVAARVQNQIVETVGIAVDATKQEGEHFQWRRLHTRRFRIGFERLQRNCDAVVHDVGETVNEAWRRSLHQSNALQNDIGDDGSVARLRMLHLDDAFVVLLERDRRLVVLEVEMCHQLQQFTRGIAEDADLVGDEVREDREYVRRWVLVEDVLVPDGQQKRLGNVVGEERQQPGGRVDGWDDVLLLEVERQF